MAGDECREALEALYVYLDGELTEERRIIIKGHLDDCPSCGDAFDFTVELRQVVAQRCREEVPEALRLRIAQALGQEVL